MALISVRVLTEQGLSVALVRGELTLDDLSALIQAYPERPTEDLLFIYRELDGKGVSPDSVRQFASAVLSQAAKGRTAFVADSNLEFGLTRLFEAHTAEKDSVYRQVFREISSAAEWLGIEVTQLDAILSELEHEDIRA